VTGYVSEFHGISASRSFPTTSWLISPAPPDRAPSVGCPDCGCVFDYVSARLPYDEYLEADRTDPEDWSPRVNEVLADAFSRSEGTADEPVA
jgi:hypothetical protein